MGPVKMRESLTTTPGIREQPRPGGDIVQSTGLHGLEPQPLALCGLVRAASIPAALTIGKCVRSENPVLMRG